MFAPHGLCRQAILRCSSAHSEANFLFTTGYMGAEFANSVDLLRRHGFTVVKAQNDCPLPLSSEKEGEIIRRAIAKVNELYNDGGPAEMPELDEAIAKRVLLLLGKSYPRAVNMIDLKHGLEPEPSDELLLIALDALLIEKYIEGVRLRGSDGRLTDLGSARITSAGKETLSPGTRPTSPAGTVIHGDQINNHGSAGAIGRYSHGIIHLDRWTEIQNQVDLGVLAEQLDRLRGELKKVANSRQDDKQLALLAEAADEAEKQNGRGVATILSGATNVVLKTAQSIGTDLAVKVILHMANLS